MGNEEGRFAIVNYEERGKEMDKALQEVQEVFNKYKINNFEAVWLLNMMLFDIAKQDYRVD
mgnify:CR=1 FL=1